MGKKGVKPMGKVKCIWSAEFAYAIGLIVTDGCLSSDGRHISFVSKDKEQINNFMQCLNLKVKIGTTAGYKNKKVLILGLGLNQGGVGSACFFAKNGATATRITETTTDIVKETI